SHLSQTIRLVQANLHPKLKIRGILLTMYDGRTNIAKQVQDEVRKHFDNTFRAVIPRSVRLSEAPSHGEPIQIYDPRSPGAVAYDELADELLEQLRGPARPVEARGGF
ncbi:MAG: ParA family protein, partial [Chloroflexota bacterium]